MTKMYVYSTPAASLMAGWTIRDNDGRLTKLTKVTVIGNLVLLTTERTVLNRLATDLVDVISDN